MPTLLDRMARPLARRGLLTLPATTTAGAPVPAQRAMPRTVEKPDADIGAALFRYPQRAGLLPGQARQFYVDNEWCRACVDRLIGRVSRAERLVEPLDAKKPYSKRLRQRIADGLENPNPRGDSFRSFMEPVLKDVLLLGKGGWEYVRNWRGQPLAMYPFNAEYLSVNPNWDGSNLRQPRYYWTPVPRQSIPLDNEEVTLMLWAPSTDRVEGLSPLDTLRHSVEADSAGNEFVRDMLKRFPPPGWLELGAAAGPRQVAAVKEKLSTDVLGRGGFLVTGGLADAKFTSLWNGSSRDNELMAWSLYFARKVAAVFGISAQELSILMDVNRSTADSQQDISAETGYLSLLQFTAEYLNREYVPKWGGTPEELNLHVTFRALTLGDQQRRVDLAKAMVGSDKGVPVATLNEGRKVAGLDAIEGGNAIFVASAGTVTALLGDDAEAHRQQMADEASQRLQTQTDIATAAEPDQGDGDEDDKDDADG